MYDDHFLQDPTYAEHFGVYRKILNRLLDHDPAMFELPRDIRIVDIGCGYGDLLKTLRSRGYMNLLGVEPDQVCREGARREGFDVQSGTIAQTGLPDACADAAIVNAVFHHIEDYASAISELARILTPKGLLCFIEPAPTIFRRGMDFLTFHTPLPKISKAVATRFAVMKLEMETGMYPRFLAEQDLFHSALENRFQKLWLRHDWFFQFGKYRRR